MSETQSIEQFVKHQIQNGKYESYEAMVQAGLKLLQEREREIECIAEKLRPAAERFKRGEPGIPFDAEEFIRQARKRHTEENRST